VAEIKATIEALETVCDVALITLATTDKALALHSIYGYSFYDSLILASAIENECKYVISEDLHSGAVIDERTTILNVFK
jgi:predicted nucleic acid-binding protein